MAQGFKQYNNLIYSHVVKSSTIIIIMFLAVNSGYKLRQLDVKNAFLKGKLVESAFIAQPPGYLDKDNPDFIYKLNKVIYGL